jgi:hypothetical protein
VSREWIDRINETVEEQSDPDGSGDYVAWVTGHDPPADPFSLLIADVLQNLRTSLDQLAFELASAHTSPLPNEIAQRSEFPVFGDENGDGSARFHQRRSRGAAKGQPAPGSGLSKTEGMHPDAQRVIEGLQPYNRRNGFEDDPLWRLHTLNRLEKHRALHATVAHMSQLGLPPEAGRAILVHGGAFQIIGGPVKGRAEILRWHPDTALPPNQPRLNVRPGLHIIFDPATPLIGDENVLVALGRMHDYIVSDVLPPLARFLN